MRTPGLDPALPFHPLNIAVLTVSDKRTIETDTAGALLVARLTAAGHRLAARTLVAGDIGAIQAPMRAWVADPGIDVIICTGGTGFTARDVTPEAVLPLLRRVMDGFSVLFHQVSMGSIGVSTLQSRAFAGQADDSFIFCVPGSPGACGDAWDHILALEFDSRYRPCSIAGQVPRLRNLCA